MDFPGVSLQTPGTLSRGAVLDVGLRCPHSCAFCYYSFFDGTGAQFAGLRRAGLRSTADCLEIVREIARQGLTHLDITGGEPCIHPDLPDIVAEAARLGLAVRVITLGQFLLRGTGTGTLLDRLLGSGLTDVLFSLHAAEPAAFKATCGGSLEAVLAAMDVLDARGFQYGCNTVIMERNRRQLPAIARLAAARGVYTVNFIAFNAYHAWRGQEQAATLEASFTKIRPYLEEAVAILTAAGIAVNIRYVPLCAFPSLARHVVGVLGVAYDPYEWRNRCLNHDRPPAYCAEPLPIPDSGVRAVYAFSPLAETVPTDVAVCGMRGDRFKFFPETCRDCPARPACDGVDPVYLARHGAGEFSPLAEVARGPLLASRLAYLPPFLVKRSPDAPMRAAIAAQPEPRQGR
uniref:Putative Fe-S oxidoreductase n=1 Tax=Desulfovibrio sp. U5L TaxID=596152 RepID=I2Q7J9_9BACT